MSLLKSFNYFNWTCQLPFFQLNVMFTEGLQPQLLARVETVTYKQLGLFLRSLLCLVSLCGILPYTLNVENTKFNMWSWLVNQNNAVNLRCQCNTPMVGYTGILDTFVEDSSNIVSKYKRMVFHLFFKQLTTQKKRFNKSRFLC